MPYIFDPDKNFFSLASQILANGVVYFCEPDGTANINNLKTIYTTNAMSVTASNPQTLTASGRFAQEVHGTGLYDVVIKSAVGGSTIRTLYNVPVSYSGFARTAAEVSAGITPTNTVYEPGNVLRYGADSTGSADSATAFTNALNAMGTTGGVVTVPKGTYKIASAIVWPKTPDGYGLKMIGDSPGATRINFTGTGYLFTFGDGDVNYSSFFNTIQDLSMYGNGAVGQSGCLKLNSAYYWRVINCIIRNFTTAGAKGIYAVAGKPNYHGEVALTQIYNIPTGISLEGSGGIGGNSNVVRNSWFGVHSSEAIHLDAVSGNWITFNEFNGSTTTAVKLSNNCDVNKILFNQMDGPTNSVVFNSNPSSPRQIIFGNTGGDSTTTGIISGSGTNSLIYEANLRQLWSGQGLIIGDATKPATTSVPLTVRAVASISTSAFLVENSASAYLFKVDGAGSAEAKGNLTSHGQASFRNDVLNNATVVEIDNATGTTAAANVLLSLKGHASQSGNGIQITDSSGTVLFFITPAGRIHFGATTSSPGIMSGSGTPEGAVTAPVGSMYLRSNGGASTCLYIKESGTGNTGWVAK